MSVHDVRPLRRVLADHACGAEIIGYLDEGLYEEARNLTADAEIWEAVADCMSDTSAASLDPNLEPEYLQDLGFITDDECYDRREDYYDGFEAPIMTLPL